LADSLPEKQQAYLQQGSESRSLDFKQSMPWDNSSDFQLKVIRTILAMSNLPDGGAIVLGIAEDSTGAPQLAGVTTAHYETYNTDNVAARVTSFADPPVNLQVIRGEFEGNRYVVIEVEPFWRVPTVCKKGDGGKNILRQAAVYVRPLGKPETREVASATEMLELIELAVRARLGEYQSMGLIASPPSNAAISAATRAEFDLELGDLL